MQKMCRSMKGNNRKVILCCDLISCFCVNLLLHCLCRYAILDVFVVQHCFRQLRYFHMYNYALYQQDQLVQSSSSSSSGGGGEGSNSNSSSSSSSSSKMSSSSSSRGQGEPQKPESLFSAMWSACPQCGVPYGAVPSYPSLYVCGEPGCVSIPTRSYRQYKQHCANEGHVQNTVVAVCEVCTRRYCKQAW